MPSLRVKHPLPCHQQTATCHFKRVFAFIINVLTVGILRGSSIKDHLFWYVWNQIELVLPQRGRCSVENLDLKLFFCVSKIRWDIEVVSKLGRVLDFGKTANCAVDRVEANNQSIHWTDPSCRLRSIAATFSPDLLCLPLNFLASPPSGRQIGGLSSLSPPMAASRVSPFLVAYPLSRIVCLCCTSGRWTWVRLHGEDQVIQVRCFCPAVLLSSVFQAEFHCQCHFISPQVCFRRV